MRLPARVSGRRWEQIAAGYLRRSGIKILELGFAGRHGEIDLIGRDGDELVMFEIKARRGGAKVASLESVHFRKQSRILKTARFYLLKHPDVAELPIRFDVIGIDEIDSVRPRITWIKDAFQST